MKQLKEKVNYHKQNKLSYNHKQIKKTRFEKIYEEWALKTIIENPVLFKYVGYRAETRKL